ncbi:COP9 signalosome complex subunit 6-like [Stegodyphus dumicola]|uniref:COP9 signalosome complex subunit 6-like n=1 Tax=Stegodyphus dumicola TaxID=202533 RepID=UPI0015B2D262|nr:COP9 signalosome complex subunit 6-like [Stegodyphus dumicola]
MLPCFCLFNRLYIYFSFLPSVKQVFSELDFLGWYTTGDNVNESDIKIHKQPLFLKLNPVGRHTELPVLMYESVIDLVVAEATMLFVELSYTLATEEAERIGLDHMARMSANEAGESSLVAEQLQAQHSAIKMLHSRVRLILDYIRAVKEGKVPANHEILREAYSLCHRLPVISTDFFKEEYFNQCNDVGLMTYLGTLTKGCNTINQFVNKFNILYDRQGMGRRMKGFFF